MGDKKIQKGLNAATERKKQLEDRMKRAESRAKKFKKEYGDGTDSKKMKKFMNEYYDYDYWKERDGHNTPDHELLMQLMGYSGKEAKNMDEARNYVKKDMQRHLASWEDWDAINSTPVIKVTNKHMDEVNSFINTYNGREYKNLSREERKDFKKKSRKFRYLNR